MDQPDVEIYVVRRVGHARTCNAAVLPQTSGRREFPGWAGFCTGLAFLRVARTAVRFIDLNVADLTFAGRPRRQAPSDAGIRIGTSGFEAKEDRT